MMGDLKNGLSVLLSITWILLQGNCQLIDNTPPTMYLDRHWKIDENLPVGSRLAQVHAHDNENDPLEFGLEAITPFDETDPSHLPFKIDSTGVVYLNENLKGRAGQNLRLFVIVSDGQHTVKNEVYANILNASAPHTSQNNSPFSFSGNNLRPPQFANIPGFTPKLPSHYNNPPISTYNGFPNSKPYFQQKTYPESPKNSSKTERTDTKTATSSDSTILKPIKIEDASKNTTSDSKDKSTENSTVENEKVVLHKAEKDNKIDEAVKSEPDLAVTLVPILSVCAVFFAVGVIAVVFRKKIYFNKKKNSKEDIRKDSSGGAVIQEDPGLAMQQWRGPRAFSNRYESWEREGGHNHQQVTGQLSSNIKNADRWEFPRHRLKFFNILGEGAFGQVWKCEAIDLEEKDEITVVAVKTLKENANEKERSDLISELQVMKMLDPHPNVVRLLGCCSEKEPIFLIMEYVTRGKLQSYLRNSRAERYYNNMHGQSKSLTSRDLTSFVYQVAKGMDFLSQNGIIHRDLAARNVLITEDHVCKVADFGFARDVIASHVYERKSEGRLPIRWMAPESLYDNIFSVKSDVWSFGILMWEVVTLGSTPYPGLSAAEVMRKVRDGFRLDKPEHCRREIYNIMYYCWDKDPKQRPTFPECVELLEKLLMSETDYIELERFPDHSYYNMICISGEKL